MFEQSSDGKKLRILPLESKCVTPMSIKEGKELCVWESTEHLVICVERHYISRCLCDKIWKRTHTISVSCNVFHIFCCFIKQFPVLTNIICSTHNACDFEFLWDDFLSFNRSKLESYIWLQYSLKVRCPSWDKNLIKYLCEFVIYWE
jgi:hypothetical protein